MAKKTQGTELYFIDAGDVVVKVGGVRSISGMSASRGQMETTDLDAIEARTYEAGLMTPGAATFEVQFDPTNASHKKLHDLYKAGTTVKWALGWSDGFGIAPTATTGDFTLPTTRTFLDFEGYVTDIPFNLDLDSVVTSSISLQVSGFPNLTVKA